MGQIKKKKKTIVGEKKGEEEKSRRRVLFLKVGFRIFLWNNPNQKNIYTCIYFTQNMLKLKDIFQQAKSEFFSLK